GKRLASLDAAVIARESPRRNRHASLHRNRRISPRERAHRRQEPEPGRGIDARFNVLRITNYVPQHLISAADADHRAALACSGTHGRCYAAFPEPLKIGDCALASGQYHGVGGSEFRGCAGEANPNPWLAGERLEIVEV